MNRLLVLLTATLGAAAPCFAQGFTSGSDGSDGALNVTTSGDFDPAALGLDADGDGIYHFTTINVAAGVSLRLRASILGEGRPVVWLATGAVTIEGTLNLNGARGHLSNAPPLPSEAGAGGFSGGTGRTTLARATSGSGPGGGIVQSGSNGGHAGHALGGSNGGGGAVNGGPAYGNVFLLPLTGGSGGAGYDNAAGNAGGGAGGGAILIASSTSISVNGSISARGGERGANGAGRGSGGGVRLIAPTCSGTGSVDVTAGGGANASAGRVRIEAYEQQFTSVTPLNIATFGRPGPVLLPALAPRVRATQLVLADTTTVNIPADPKGSFVMPDAVVDTADPLTLNLAAENVPVGTQVSVRIVPEGAAAIVLTSTPLAGTKASSTASAGPFSLPTGYTRFSISVSFTP